MWIFCNLYDIIFVKNKEYSYALLNMYGIKF
jgi:uncharacterized membrane protein